MRKVIPLTILIVAVAAAVLAYATITTHAATTRAQCVRANTQTATDNRSHYLDYRFATLQINQAVRDQASNYAALRKVGIDKRVLDRALRESNQQIVAEKAEADGKTWTALINCAANPTSTDIQIHPIVRYPPPWWATDFYNSRKADPVGSIR